MEGGADRVGARGTGGKVDVDVGAEGVEYCDAGDGIIIPGDAFAGGAKACCAAAAEDDPRGG